MQYEYRVKKLGQFMDHIKSYATSKFRKNEVFVSKMHRYPDPSLSLSLETIFSLKSIICFKLAEITNGNEAEKLQIWAKYKQKVTKLSNHLQATNGLKNPLFLAR